MNEFEVGQRVRFNSTPEGTDIKPGDEGTIARIGPWGLFVKFGPDPWGYNLFDFVDLTVVQAPA